MRRYNFLLRFLLGISGLMFVGCSPVISTESVFPNNANQTGSCAADALPNDYVIHWKSGEVTQSLGKTREELIQAVVTPHLKDIQLVEPNFKIHIDSIKKQILPRDVSGAIAQFAGSRYMNWNVQATSAANAWSPTVSGAGITVAVIDSGVDTTHPQLQGQIFINLAEKNGQPGVDDDKNGFVDDISGWNFANNTPNQNDVIGHGTHVSGTIGAIHSNPQLPMGLAPNVKIMPLQFITDETSGGTTLNAIRAIQYASMMGAKVMNASWGSDSCSQTLESIVSGLDRQEALFIVAAGNSSHDLTVYPEYPAAFNGAHQITVAASAIEFLRASFSNFGALVPVAAPGMDIISTYPGNQYALMDGTSMATPVVSGEAALLWSVYPQATASQVKAAILAGVDLGISGVATGGQVNVEKALAYLQQSPAP